MKPDVGNFWSLWLSERDFFFKMCMRWLHGRRHEVEDVLGRGAINGFEFIVNHPAGVHRFRPWMLRILYNLSIDSSRSRSRCAGLDDLGPADDEPAAPLVCTVDIPERVLLREELATSLAEAAANLPPRLHEVYTLRFVEEMPYEAISQALNISQTNARKRIQVVRELLREQLKAFA